MNIILFVFMFLISKPLSAKDLACPPGETQVRPHIRKEYKKLDGTMVGKTNVIEHCREFFPTSKDWFLKFKNSSPTDWPNILEQRKDWNPQEIVIILEILSQLPTELRSAFDGNLYRFINSIFKDNPSSVDTSGKSLGIYDAFFKLIRKEQEVVIVHELSHFLFEKLPYLEKNNFSILSGWSHIKGNSQKGILPEIIPPKSTIENDSSESTSEDFANHVEVFISNPIRHKNFNPKIHEWFKQKFLWLNPKVDK